METQKAVKKLALGSIGIQLHQRGTERVLHCIEGFRFRVRHPCMNFGIDGPQPSKINGACHAGSVQWLGYRWAAVLPKNSNPMSILDLGIGCWGVANRTDNASRKVPRVLFEVCPDPACSGSASSPTATIRASTITIGLGACYSMVTQIGTSKGTLLC